MKDNGFPDEEIGNLTDAVARVHRQIQEGADGVKLFAGAIVGGEVGVLPMPLDQARALVEAAHPMSATPMHMTPPRSTDCWGARSIGVRYWMTTHRKTSQRLLASVSPCEGDALFTMRRRGRSASRRIQLGACPLRLGEP